MCDHQGKGENGCTRERLSCWKILLLKGIGLRSSVNDGEDVEKPKGERAPVQRLVRRLSKSPSAFPRMIGEAGAAQMIEHLDRSNGTYLCISSPIESQNRRPFVSQ